MVKKTSEGIRPLTKGTAITVGSLILIAGGVAAVVGVMRWHSSEALDASKSAVRIHADRDIDRAHKDIKSRYVSKRELNGKLHAIDTRLMRIEEQQKAILERLPISRHWTRIDRDLRRRRGVRSTTGGNGH